MKSEQEGTEINSWKVSLIMLEKVWSVRRLADISRNSVSVYILKLLSLRKSESFSVSIDPQM